MLEKTKKTRVAIGAALLVTAMILEGLMPDSNLISYFFLGAWLIAGVDIIYQAFLNLKQKMLLAEHFLMSIATLGAIGIGEYKEAAMVMVLFQIGELLEDAAIDKSRASISELMDITAPIAYRIEGDTSVEIDPEDIRIGDILEVRAGQKIPVDGKVVKGSSSLDTSALTGESIPVSVDVSDKVLSGSINGQGWLLIEAEKEASDSTAMRIVEMLEEATENRAETESYITKFAKIYTPIVVGFAIIISFIVPLFVKDAVFSDWFKRGLIFLVVSCPCAFVVSVPMSFVMGLGLSSKMGMLVKGGNVFEMVEKVNLVATDKTGTITEGKFGIIGKEFFNSIEEKEFLSIANALEKGSSHPIANAIREYSQCSNDLENIEFDDINIIEGKGLKGVKSNKSYILGNSDYMLEEDLKDVKELKENSQQAIFVHLAMVEPEKKYLGYYKISDRIKAGSREAIAKLYQYVDEVVMLTGDSELVAENIAKEAGIKEYHARLLPQDKLEWIQKSSKVEKKYTAFVGDGLNDAPVIAASDVGIAMGGIGSDATIEASDVVLINDDLKSLPRLFYISNYTMKIARQNIWFSLGIKLIFLILSAFGMTQMWMAVFADVGVTLIAIANTFRIYFLGNKVKNI